MIIYVASYIYAEERQICHHGTDFEHAKDLVLSNAYVSSFNDAQDIVTLYAMEIDPRDPSQADNSLHEEVYRVTEEDVEAYAASMEEEGLML